ncbi:MAG: hypothetical protein AB7O56_00115 [Bauldia sp.]
MSALIEDRIPPIERKAHPPVEIDIDDFAAAADRVLSPGRPKRRAGPVRHDAVTAGLGAVPGEREEQAG